MMASPMYLSGVPRRSSSDQIKLGSDLNFFFFYTDASR